MVAASDESGHTAARRSICRCDRTGFGTNPGGAGRYDSQSVGELAGVLESTLSRSASLWRALLETESLDPLWSPVSIRISYDEEARPTTEIELLLDGPLEWAMNESNATSPAAVDGTEGAAGVPLTPQDIVLVPVPELMLGESEHTVVLHLGDASVSTEHVSDLSLRQLTARLDGELYGHFHEIRARGFAFIPLSYGRLPDAPLVTTRSRSGSRANPGLFDKMRVSPVTWLRTAFDLPLPIGEVIIDTPNFATADRSVLTFRIDTRPISLELEGLLADADAAVAQGSPAAAHSHVASAASAELTDLLMHVREILSCAAPSEHKAWCAQLLDAREQLDIALSTIRQGGPQVVVATRSIAKWLARDLEFRLVFRSTHGKLDIPDALHRVRGIRLVGAVTPVTTEREPRALGIRAIVLLGMLAAFMGVFALSLWSWFPAKLDSWRGGHLKGDLTDATVAILVFFPGLLYSQFFQSRPVTWLGHHAEFTAFAMLSLPFALPLGPAALVALGFDRWIVFVAASIAALVAAAGAWFVYSFVDETSLRELRAGAAWYVGAAASEPTPGVAT
jgi:hypothetical protein